MTAVIRQTTVITPWALRRAVTFAKSKVHSSGSGQWCVCAASHLLAHQVLPWGRLCSLLRGTEWINSLFLRQQQQICSVASCPLQGQAHSTHTRTGSGVPDSKLHCLWVPPTTQNSSAYQAGGVWAQATQCYQRTLGWQKVGEEEQV